MNNIESYDQLLESLKEYIHDQADLDLIQKSYEYATNAHKGIKRRSGEDYITHPLNTAYILTSLNADSTIISAAILHDVLKNEDITYDDILNNFGKDIADIVNGVSKLTNLNFELETKDDINKQRKILVGLTEDVRVLMIKLAERLHNMRTIESQPLEKQKEKALETLEIYAPIAHGIGMGKIKSELEDISLKYAKPEGYNSVVSKLNETKEQRDKYIETMIKEVSNLLDENNIKHKIKGRSKGIYSIFRKLDKGKRFEDIYDILALRVFVDTVPECYQALGIIHSKYKPIPKRIKDFIAMPKANMYQSLHTTVYGIDNQLFEIQIRTYEMDEIAERGIASHWSYKENGGHGGKSNLEQRLQFFRSILELNNEQDDLAFVKNVKEEVFNGAIYVYTPQGKVIELKQGSTPIDFAYRIHSDIGDKMVGAMVNGNIVPLDYELHDNDVVKINTNKNQAGPSYEWLNIVKTENAKSKIKAYFNKIDKEEAIKKGEELLYKELRKKKIIFNEFLCEENVNKILKEYRLNSLDDVYLSIGKSNINVNSIINFVLDINENKEDIMLKKSMNSNYDVNIKNDIIVDGIDEIKVNLASCCKPIPGDLIVGYITKGYGINVHRKDCKNIISLDERIINVRWNANPLQKYPTNIKISALKKNDLLVTIISKFGNNNITIKSINTSECIDNVIFDLTILVTKKDVLDKLINDIKSISEVISVERSYV